MRLSSVFIYVPSFCFKNNALFIQDWPVGAMCMNQIMHLVFCLNHEICFNIFCGKLHFTVRKISRCARLCSESVSNMMRLFQERSRLRASIATTTTTSQCAKFCFVLIFNRKCKVNKQVPHIARFCQDLVAFY